MIDHFPFPTRSIARYGWRRDTPVRNKPLFMSAAPARNLKSSYDLRSQFEPAYDQGQTGSCVGNSTAGAYYAVRKLLALPLWTPSRLFIYYAARALEGCQREDAGAQIHDAFTQLVARGAPPETDWPFDANKVTSWPPMRVWNAAVSHHALTHEVVPQTLTAVKGAFDAGLPVVFGFTVYGSFESDDVARTGIMPMPGPKEQQSGGHAVCAVGCDDARKALLVRNSWGTGWGIEGYFWMPYAVAFDPDQASDFQLIRKIAA